MTNETTWRCPKCSQTIITYLPLVKPPECRIHAGKPVPMAAQQP